MSECMDCRPKKMAVVERWALWRDGVSGELGLGLGYQKVWGKCSCCSAR